MAYEPQARQIGVGGSPNPLIADATTTVFSKLYHTWTITLLSAFVYFTQSSPQSSEVGTIPGFR